MAVDIIQANDGLGDYVIVSTGRGEPIYISPEDYEFVTQRNWWLSDKGYVIGKERVCEGEWRHLKLHRELMIHWGYDIADLNVDHRNGVRHDNRRGNLRPATDAENTQNIHKRWGKIEYLGVKLHKGGYFAYVRKDREKYYLGLYKTAELAACACDLKKLEIYDFVDRTALNFPNNPLYETTTFDEFYKAHAYQPASLYNGVDVQKVRKNVPFEGYRARVRLPNRGKEISYSTFEYEQDAARCVDIARIEVFGLKAIDKLNFPPESYPGFLEGNYTGISSVEFHRKYAYKSMENKVGYVGVFKYSKNYYKGLVIKDKVRNYTDKFKDEKEAAIAVDRLRLEICGSEALRLLNFPLSDYMDLVDELGLHDYL